MQALENLVRTGQLIREPTSVEEVSGFLTRAEHQLIDARTASLNAASRFSLAYDAAHAFALAAPCVYIDTSRRAIAGRSTSSSV